MGAVASVATLHLVYLGLVVWSFYQGKKVQRRQCDDLQHGEATQRIRQQPWNAHHGRN